MFTNKSIIYAKFFKFSIIHKWKVYNKKHLMSIHQKFRGAIKIPGHFGLIKDIKLLILPL